MCIVHYMLKGFQTYFIHPEGSSVNFDLIKDISPHLPFTVAVNEKLYFEVFTKTKTFIRKIMLYMYNYIYIKEIRVLFEFFQHIPRDDC